MFFDSLEQASALATRTSCAVFVVPPDTDLGIPHAITLFPDANKKTRIISVEQVREFIALTTNRETRDRYFIIAPADALNEPAQNALLKTLEEPHPFCHFLLLTEQPNLLLPTILSRAEVFAPRITNKLDQPPVATPEVVSLAKRLIAATPQELPAIAVDLVKQKNQAREQTIAVTATAIELLYKTYFKTKNSKFLAKLPKFIQLYEHLNQNGHLKLHLVADLC